MFGVVPSENEVTMLSHWVIIENIKKYENFWLKWLIIMCYVASILTHHYASGCMIAFEMKM